MSGTCSISFPAQSVVASQGATAACLIVAAIYLFVGLAGFTILSSLKPRPASAAPLAKEPASVNLRAEVAGLLESTGLTEVAVMWRWVICWEPLVAEGVRVRG